MGGSEGPAVEVGLDIVLKLLGVPVAVGFLVSHGLHHHRFEFGAAVPLRDGGDVTLISTGVQTARVVEAAELLAAAGIAAHVLHLPTLKPIDTEAIVAAADRTDRGVTSEEHTVLGGLGGAVSEVLSAHRPTRVDRIGIEDHYTESASNEDLLDLYGLSADRVAERVRLLLSNEGKTAA